MYADIFELVPKNPYTSADLNYSNSSSRVVYEYQNIENHELDGVYAVPYSEDSYDKWFGMILGPEGTPYQNGVFILSIEFNDYPASPPVIKFETDIYHPNVYTDGRICLSILK